MRANPIKKRRTKQEAKVYSILSEANKRFSSYKPKFCIANNHKCSEGIASSHAIQNGVILDNVSENGHVYVLRPNPDQKISFLKEGKNKTVTFKLYCPRHDQLLFNAIDFKNSAPKDDLSDNQLLQFHTKALSLEYWTKSARFDLTAELFQNFKWSEKIEKVLSIFMKYSPWIVPSSLKEKWIFQKMLQFEQEGIKILRDEIGRDLFEALDALANDSAHSFVFKQFSFDMDKAIAASLIFDFFLFTDNHALVMQKESSPFASLTIFPLGGKTHILIGYNRRFDSEIGKVLNEIEALPEKNRSIWLSSILMSSYENIVFSPKIIERLSPKIRATIEQAIEESNSSQIPDSRSPLNVTKKKIFVDFFS